MGSYRGEPGGMVTRYSDTLMIFLLKSLRPEVYSERFRHEHNGSVLHKLAAMSTEELLQMEHMSDAEVRKLLTSGDEGGPVEMVVTRHIVDDRG